MSTVYLDVNEEAYNDKVFMIIGVADAVITPQTGSPEQKSIVGVATTVDQAKEMIGQDYLDVVSASGVNPLFNVVRELSLDSQEGVLGYGMVGYSWYIIPMNKNEVVNYTL